VFNVRASYFDETESIVAQLMASDMKKIAVLYQNDAYGKAGLEGVTRAMAKRNAKIVGSATVERNSTDVSAGVASLKILSPEAIVQITAYASAAAFIREMKKSGYSGQFVNVSFVGSKALADLLGKDSAGVVVSQVVPFPWAGSTPLQFEYTQAMKKSGVPDRSFGSMEGFIAAKMFAEAVSRAGKNLTRERLIDAFESMQKVDLGGFSLSFSKTSHNGSQFVEMTMIGQGGRFIK
jgi:ABC-type branched-subunit amino acid transport system substrate-binding protein